jgi:hypothetical protein
MSAPNSPSALPTNATPSPFGAQVENSAVPAPLVDLDVQMEDSDRPQSPPGVQNVSPEGPGANIVPPPSETGAAPCPSDMEADRSDSVMSPLSQSLRMSPSDCLGKALRLLPCLVRIPFPWVRLSEERSP